MAAASPLAASTDKELAEIADTTAKLEARAAQLRATLQQDYKQIDDLVKVRAKDESEREREKGISHKSFLEYDDVFIVVHCNAEIINFFFFLVGNHETEETLERLEGIIHCSSLLVVCSVASYFKTSLNLISSHLFFAAIKFRGFIKVNSTKSCNGAFLSNGHHIGSFEIPYHCTDSIA